jgi:8-oxo-dGTP pyrophosphatase MutT (NUDIX family)
MKVVPYNPIYTLVYAKPLQPKNSVLLVLKNKPAFLAGRLNLPGGRVESTDATITQAGARELKEETGLEPAGEITINGVIHATDCRIYCLTIPVNETKLSPRPEETEKADWYNWGIVSKDDRLMTNLKVIIPLLHMGVMGWEISGCGVISPNTYELNIHLELETLDS